MTPSPLTAKTRPIYHTAGWKVERLPGTHAWLATATDKLVPVRRNFASREEAIEYCREHPRPRPPR